MNSKPKTTELPQQCDHQIVEDLIDLTPTRSKYIYYCEKCYTCFSDSSGNATLVEKKTETVSNH
jgi:hypothetical protein